MPAAAVVLVEGESDRVAVEALATRRGRDLAAEGVEVVAIGGATNIRAALTALRRDRPGIRVAGLYDAAEEGHFRRSLGVDDRAGLESLGFFVCDADLEDELIRSLGIDAVERVVEAAGELRAFRTLQHQPAQHGRSHHAQLRRFLGSKGGRKIRYARLLVDALDPALVPRPLDRVLTTV